MSLEGGQFSRSNFWAILQKSLEFLYNSMILVFAKCVLLSCDWSIIKKPYQALLESWGYIKFK